MNLLVYLSGNFINLENIKNAIGICMKKKIIGIVVCTLMLSLIVPVNGFQSDLTTNISTMYSEPSTQLTVPPPPGWRDHFSQSECIDSSDLSTEVIPILPERSILDPTIVSIISQINASLVLGYIQNITSFGSRVTGTQSCRNASAYIYNQFLSLGLFVRYHNWTYGSHTGSDIEATLPAEYLGNNEIYLICGHYDAVSGSSGADDNAAGTAVALVAAFTMHKYQFNHTVRFVAFDGEEQGLLGSYCYVQQAVANNDNIVAVFNADMIGFATVAGDDTKVKLYGNSSETDWILTYTSAISSQYSLGLQVLNSGSSSGSDHYFFDQYGYDAVFYQEYHFNSYYHSSQDTIAHMNMTYDAKITSLIVATLASLAEPVTMEHSPCGDANSDGIVDISDAVFLIQYIFAGGYAPYPLCSGDANGDGSVNISDAVYLIAYIFSGGPAPVTKCCE